jgi:hypothetical protein
LQESLIFQNFWLKSIFVFPIPEMLGNQKNVEKAFQRERLIEKLSKCQALDKRLNNFTKAEPIFDYSRQGKYKDQFWEPYYNLLSLNRPSHFPFKMYFQPNFNRVVDPQGLNYYGSRLICRLYCYGAVSLTIEENYEYNDSVNTQDLVKILEQPILVQYKNKDLPDKTFTQAGFFESIRSDILKQVLKKMGTYPTITCEPQKVVIKPKLSRLPDKNSCWIDIATLLAKSIKTEHIKKMDINSFSENYGNPKQQLLFSPKTSLIFTPDLDTAENYAGARCLFERVSNISEMVVIQKEYIKFFKNRYDQITNEIINKKGYLLGQLSTFLHNWKDGLKQEMETLDLLLNFQDKLSWRKEKDWLEWYCAMLSDSSADLATFLEKIKNLDSANIDLGKDVRGSISGALDNAKKIKDILPSK